MFVGIKDVYVDYIVSYFGKVIGVVIVLRFIFFYGSKGKVYLLNDIMIKVIKKFYVLYYKN